MNFKTLLVLCAIACTSVHAPAATMSKPTKQTSTASYRSEPAPVYRAPAAPAAAPAPKRMGGGQPVGMTRPDVMQRVRQEPAQVAKAPVAAATPMAPAAPRPTTQSTYAPVPAPVEKKSGYGLGSLAAAAAGGAILTSVLSGPSHAQAPAPTYPQQAPTYQSQPNYPAQQPDYAPQPGYAPTPVAQQPQVNYQPQTVTQPRESHWFLETLDVIGTFLLLGGVVLLGWWAYNKYVKPKLTPASQDAGVKVKNDIEYAAQPPASAFASDFAPTYQQAVAPTIPFAAVARFEEIQKAYFTGDQETLKARLTPELATSMIEQIGEDANQAAAFNGYDHLTCALADEFLSEDDVISLHYKGDDLSDGTVINEVWHFTRDAVNRDNWLLAGMEPV